MFKMENYPFTKVLKDIAMQDQSLADNCNAMNVLTWKTTQYLCDNRSLDILFTLTTLLCGRRIHNIQYVPVQPT